uniref:TSA: Wollemia nobilis Ref_Wollemi_Transcript_15323_1461 transcribed RNA sequence n=1 Tax=Wollemia nobilis TaxID=56998 RepID=A0A0C9S694_9CONI
MASVSALLSVGIALIALFIGTDPLGISLLAQHPSLSFKAVQLHPLSSQLKIRDEENRLKKAEIVAVVDGAVGPESLAFDNEGRGPYTGISDGRVLRWDGPQLGWTHFAVTSPNRSEVCDPKNPPAPRPEFEHICGRPLGMRFHRQTGELYIADAYFGLLVVNSEGGLAKIVVNEAEGLPLRFTNDLDFDEGGVIYFTDTSTVFQRRHFLFCILSGDDTGRLMKYDPKSGEITVLLRNLKFANGVAMSKDFSFLLVSETTNCRILRYWLKGPRAGSSEVFALLPGFPDNVRRNAQGDFWVALHSRRNLPTSLALSYPWLRWVLFKLPLSTKQLYYIFTGGIQQAIAIRLDENGNILEVLEDQQGSTVKLISEVEERNGQLWMGSVMVPSVALYSQ